jgi:predicted enzyme involved in methoxymalonyl-ACP biosynthesis
MSDKFGDMDCISILIAVEKLDYIEIPIFVLSCRVFGYRAEDAILNVVKGRAKTLNKPIIGIYKETMYNSPCKEVYKNNGFELRNGKWIFDDFSAALIQAEWFK